MLAAIHLYAAQDELPESNPLVMVQKGRYIDSKKTLYDDFCSIPLAVPATGLIQLELMLKVLGTIINLWFDQDTRDSDNYRMWTQSANLKDLRKELVGITPYKESSDFGHYCRINKKAVRGRTARGGRICGPNSK